MKPSIFYNDVLTVSYARIPRSIISKPKVTEEEARNYYDSDPEAFRVPEKIAVDYVAFDRNDYASSIEVSAESITNYYNQNIEDFYSPTEEDSSYYQTVEEAKETIVDLIRHADSMNAAAEAADELVAALSNPSLSFEHAAEERGLKIVADTPNIAADDTVEGVDAQDAFLQAAFALQQDATHYYSDPVMGENNVYVIALKEKTPSRIAEYDEVREEAFELATEQAADAAYAEKAHNIHAEIRKAVEEGSSFADAVDEQDLDVITLEPFELSTYAIEDAASEIVEGTILYPEGSVADLIQIYPDYVVAHVDQREVADESVTLPSLRQAIASSLRREKSSTIFVAWQQSLLEEAEHEDLLNPDRDPS